ncbi:lysine-specific demethylase 7B-like isoform X2 [Diabrotica virgifera virgifera]|uniref:Lysine-specific demethylase 7B-like isoform X2 n=1 Tax=Diabrotica virgifera virgifera TaxID=50390 RepID=A0A6P7FSI4_DIAVI|nr:lysine-specific demethylase 7B-like isoform X2 [Diabrotica virgifera virgifera]
MALTPVTNKTMSKMFKAQLEFSERPDFFSLSTYTMDNSYCLCGQPYDPNIFMIQCDACKDWFHSFCCNFPEYTAIEIDKFHCPRCVPTFGPSITKPVCNWHRHDYWDDNASNKPVQTGTPVFIKELCARHFTPEEEVVVHMRGQQLNEMFLTTHGFNNPITVDAKDGLDLTIPPDNFSVYDVESYIGGEMEIDVIDVCRQSNIRMRLSEYVEYFNSLNRTRVLNVVSLEFSGTGLSPFIEAPFIARTLDWVNRVWPLNYPGKPQVQKYCLLSVKGSYTDFHIDFGGTTVWYHVLKGEKIFYLIKPTPANLTLYSQWMTSTNQSETFFGDQVDQCVKCVLKQGQTMLVPTGWIHAVYTPVDSLVFGGNFLHGLNIGMQLSVYEIEKKIKTEKKFLYPNFEMINWFAAAYLLEKLTEINAQETRCPEYFLLGIKALLQALKHWNTEKDYNMVVRDQLPVTLNIPKLLKDVGKEIRHAERYIIQLNPPKPERESKRKRKKPVNKDFVDYSLLPKSTSQDFMPLSELPQTPTSAPKYSRQSPLKLTLPKVAMYPYERSSGTSSEEIPVIDPTKTLNNEEWLNVSRTRPIETVAIHRGGTVLKFKLGAKDMIPQPVSAAPPTDFMFRDDPGAQDIYDFHDDSDRDEDCFNFMIDETPQKNPKKGKARAPGSKKNKHPTTVTSDGDGSNGIESLIQASALSVPPPVGGASPSTQEAIAGMLSISQTWPINKSQRKKYIQSPIEENVSNVHQDEDYIYPSLDNSDDEDVHIFKPRGRSKVDEAWNPKARVGPLLPKMNRPAREGTKKQSVEKVLEAAAARRILDIPERIKIPKRQYRRRKIKPKVEARLQPSNTTTAAGPSTSTPTTPTSTITTPKPRKGMKTVKQRLGKILKIHKMIH